MLFRRFEDWPARLENALADMRARPFQWGVTDCCLFAADCVMAITGRDLAEPYRGRYKTKRGAFSALKRVSGGGVQAAATLALGEPLKTALLAQRGDVVLVESGEGPALGICVGVKCAYLGRAGLGFIPLSAVQMAWRV